MFPRLTKMHKATIRFIGDKVYLFPFLFFFRYVATFIFFFLKYIYWLYYYSFPIFFSLLLPTTTYPLPLPHSSCPWIMCISCLASPFPILFLTSPYLCTYHLCFLLPVTFPHYPLSPSTLIILHGIFIAVILFLF